MATQDTDVVDFEPDVEDDPLNTDTAMEEGEAEIKRERGERKTALQSSTRVPHWNLAVFFSATC